ncbi:TniQ family protein [Caballeronia zhejiangensis]|uniref:TniQ family protein n=2 Tax=Caballeronia TaxID=1827195 RepID=UPI00025BB559|nr:TniQ family protein [Caballeronia zhejiangensis]EKS71800.1 hypothetical protein BURK_008176 [Burkholderia sp. SJ98]
MWPPHTSSDVRPWPFAPRPFDDEAFGSWFGRVASRYRLSIDRMWVANQLGPLPSLTNAGWILFAPVDNRVLDTLAELARLDIARLAHIQTRTDWMIPRRHLPYCFRCLVLNPADVTAPRWKRTWLDPAAGYCDEHREPLETVRASTIRQASNMEHLLKLVSRYRKKREVRRMRLY